MPSRFLSYRGVIRFGLTPLFFLLASPSSPAGMLEDAIERSSRSPGAGSPMEKLIPRLSEDVRENFLLVYKSRSPFRKSISPAFPRVILFNDRADEILTFTGDPKRPGSDVIEEMTFDPARRRFDLAAFRLEKSGRSTRLETESCKSCHGADSRPIFDSYPLWPGFYGSFRDTFLTPSKELDDYRAFLKAAARTGVYARLDWKKYGRTSTPPFLDPKALVLDKRVGDLSAFPLLPNTRFGMAVTELNRQRIYRKLAASPRFAAERPKILADLLRCDEPANRSPAFTDRENEIYAQVVAENSARIARLDPPRREFPPGTFDMNELMFTSELGKIDRLGARLGVARADWAMALEPDSYSYFDGILSGISERKSYYLLEDFIHEILADWTKERPELRAAFQAIPIYSAYGYPFGTRPTIAIARELCPKLSRL